MSRPLQCVVSLGAYIHGGLPWEFGVLLGVKGTVYPVPLLTLYLSPTAGLPPNPGVIASSSLYHVGSLTWPITSVGLQHCIILYKTITKIYFGHTFTT